MVDVTWHGRNLNSLWCWSSYHFLVHLDLDPSWKILVLLVLLVNSWNVPIESSFMNSTSSLRYTFLALLFYAIPSFIYLQNLILKITCMYFDLLDPSRTCKTLVLACNKMWDHGIREVYGISASLQYENKLQTMHRKQIQGKINKVNTYIFSLLRSGGRLKTIGKYDFEKKIIWYRIRVMQIQNKED